MANQQILAWASVSKFTIHVSPVVYDRRRSRIIQLTDILIKPSNQQIRPVFVSTLIHCSANITAALTLPTSSSCNAIQLNFQLGIKDRFFSLPHIQLVRAQPILGIIYTPPGSQVSLFIPIMRIHLFFSCTLS